MGSGELSDKTAIITGASSGVGLYAAKALTQRGWFLVMACRDLDKAVREARRLAIPEDRYAVMPIDLGDQASVRSFVDAFRASGCTLNVLVNNAAVYLPRLEAPRRSPEGYEISVATNHFGHFLLSLLLLPNCKKRRPQAGKPGSSRSAPSQRIRRSLAARCRSRPLPIWAICRVWRPGSKIRLR